MCSDDQGTRHSNYCSLHTSTNAVYLYIDIQNFCCGVHQIHQWIKATIFWVFQVFDWSCGVEVPEITKYNDFIVCDW